MKHRGETALIGAIVDTSERDAIKIAARMLRTGVTMGTVKDACSAAMQAIGMCFTPHPECIEAVVTANQIVDRILAHVQDGGQGSEGI